MFPAEPPATSAVELDRALTVREVARLLCVGQDRVRGWLKNGQLRGMNTSDTKCRRPRFVVLPAHLDEFVKSRSAAEPQPVKRPKRRRDQIDFFP